MSEFSEELEGEPPPEGPKRGRGRAPKAGTTGPGAKGSGKAAKESAPRASRSQADAIGVLVGTLNTIVASIPALRADALTPEEGPRLVWALDQWTQSSASGKRAMGKLAKRSAVIVLAGVCVGIALPRLARRGLIPAEILGGLEDAAQQIPVEQMPEPEQPAVQFTPPYLQDVTV
jgi:hypothetical protein